MRYEIQIEGDLKNISTVFAESIFPLNIRCHCGTKHDKTITVSTLSIAKNEREEKANLVVHCPNCLNEIMILLAPATKVKIEDDKVTGETFESVKNDNAFIVGFIEVKGGLIDSIPLYEFYVKSMEDKVYFVMMKDDGFWSTIDDSKNILSISDYKITASEIK